MLPFFFNEFFIHVVAAQTNALIGNQTSNENRLLDLQKTKNKGKLLQFPFVYTPIRHTGFLRVDLSARNIAGASGTTHHKPSPYWWSFLPETKKKKFVVDDVGAARLHQSAVAAPS